MTRWTAVKSYADSGDWVKREEAEKIIDDLMRQRKWQLDTVKEYLERTEVLRLRMEALNVQIHMPRLDERP